MSDELLINTTPQETRIATIENGLLQEVQIERKYNRGLVGNIYKGKVVRTLPGMQAAFLDIGLERTGFLHINDIDLRAYGMEESETPSIAKILHDGQEILVQVLKDPISTKGARLTTNITIPSRYLVFLPNSSHIGVSQRLTDEEERERLKTIIAKFQPEFGGKGYIVRTVAEGKDEELIRSDMSFLYKLWNSLMEGCTQLKAPSLVHEDLPLIMRTIRDIAENSIDNIRIDSRSNYQELIKFTRKYIPNLQKKIEHYKGEAPIFDLYGVDLEIQKALQPKIDLKSGGYLVIDQTEAMTTIDVNTGSYVGRTNLEETIYKTNLEATKAIARQLRLRNLGGIIIVDFIDMLDPEHQRQVLRTFERYLSRDEVKTHLSKISELGLIEMTRKRTRESLERILCEPCPTCQGRGSVRTAETIAFEIFREIIRECRQYDTSKVLVLTSRKISEYLLEEQSRAIAELEEFVNLNVQLQVDESYHQEQYDVVPL